MNCGGGTQTPLIVVNNIPLTTCEQQENKVKTTHQKKKKAVVAVGRTEPNEKLSSYPG